MVDSLVCRQIALSWLCLATPALTRAQLGDAAKALSAASTTAVLAPRPAAEPPTSYRLQNGLEVVLLRDPRLPRVAVSVGYRVGAGDDPAGFRGLAHVVEHMMFEGLRDAAHSDFFDFLADGGSTDANATTDLDRTVYYEELPRERLDVALWLESNRMGYLLDRIDSHDLERARAAVLNEWDERVGGGGLRAVLAEIARVTYPEGHPFRYVNDEPDDIEAIKLADVQWFFQKYYGPGNARLVVVGDFEPSATRAEIEKRFGPLRQRELVPPAPSELPAVIAGDHLIEGVWPFRNQMCAIVWPTRDAGAEERADLDVLSRHLSTLLRDRLVDEKGDATSLYGYHDEHILGTEWSLVVSLPSEADRSKVLDAIDAAISRVRDQGLSAKALDRARSHLQRQAEFGAENLVARAYRLAASAAPALEEPFGQRARRLAAISAESVQRTAQKWLSATTRARMCMTERDGAPALGKVKSHRVNPGSKP